MNLRTARRRKHAQMAWEIASPQWFRGGPFRPRRTPPFLVAFHPDGTSTDLTHTLWNRAEKRRQREHARAQRAKAAAMGDVWFAPVAPGQPATLAAAWAEALTDLVRYARTQ